MASHLDYALLAGVSYRSTRSDDNKFPTPQNWVEIPGTYRRTDDTGFEAVSFQSGTEIVISYAGTYDKDISGDIAANAGLASGTGSAQLLQAAEYYLQIKAANHGATITLTGHSLGGGLAALVGVFFGVSATVFDEAPFAQTALFQAQNLKSYLAGKLDSQGNRLYDDTLLAPLTNYIAQKEAFGASPTLIPNANLIVNIAVQGEFLSALPKHIATTVDSIANTSPGASATNDLHSIALLSAFLQSRNTAATGQRLNEVTVKLPDLVRMIFDAKLFGFASDDADNRTLIDHLVRHEAGVQGSFAADAMATRFTTDLWKLAQDGGLTLTDGITGSPDLHDLSNTLIAFAMQFYYENSANATNATKQFLSDVTGGVQFDMADVSKSFATAFTNNTKPDLKDAKGFDYAFKRFLDGSTFTAAERELIQSVLPHLRDWYVQAGASGLASTDILNRGAFMLGGSGSDALAGGDVADLLVGNASDDVLMGGKGNDLLLGGAGNDSYVFQTGDGLDTILDNGGEGSILVDGATLTGGAQYGDNKVYKSTDGKHLYTLANDTTLLIDGQIVVEGYDKARGDLGIAYSDAPAQDNPQTTLDIKGDLKPIDTDPNQAGDQYGYDALGNIVVGTAAEADRADTLYDSAGNDHITSGGGNDILYTSRGGDNLVEAGSGRDWVYGGAGKDVIAGGADADILQGGGGNDRLYADTVISITVAIANGNSQSGSGRQGDWLSGNAGDDTLVGGADNDALFGGGGADLLLGGAGDDDLNGGVDWVPTSLNWSVVNGLFKPVTGEDHPADYGADVIYAGKGNDNAFGGRGNDVLFGEAGDDYLAGNGDNDALFGGDGKDTLWGDAIEVGGDVEANMGDDYLDGGANDDQLYGGAGNEIMIGGTGDDTLEGGAGQDIYIFNKGDGIDTVIDTQSDNNIFRFGTGVSSSDFTLRLGSLLLDMGNGDAVHIDNFDQNDVYNSVSIGSFEFADGTTLSSSELLARGFDLDGTEQSDTLMGTNISDRMNGWGGDDTLSGGAGDDTLDGGEGKNILIGGLGTDSIELAGQGQRVEYRQGDGVDTLEGNASATVVALQGAFNAAELQLEVDALGQVSVRLGSGAEDRMKLNIDSNGLQQSTLIDHFSFDDSSSLSFAALLARGVQLTGAGTGTGAGTEPDELRGTDANDLIQVGAGSHLLLGGAGADTYVIANGSTNRIDDSQDANVIRLSGAAAWSDVVLAQPAAGSNDLVFTLGSGATSTTVTIADALLRADKYSIELADGQGRSLGAFIAELAPLAVSGDSEANVILGSDQGNAVDGGAGNDQISGGAAADWLVGGDGADVVTGAGGDDMLFGGAGNDIFVIGATDGRDQIFDYEGNNTVRFASGIDPAQLLVERLDGSTDVRISLDASNSVLVRRALEGAVSTYAFADGGQWSYADLINRMASVDGQVMAGDDLDNAIEGSSAADLLMGNRGNDVLRGHNGNDELLGGEDGDELIGGGGNDVLNGGDGEDTYRFALGDGVDQIVDTAGASEIWFGAGIALANMSASRVVVAGDNYVRLAYSATDAVLIKEGVVLPGTAFNFANGTALSQAQVYAQTLADAVTTPLYTAGDDTIWGYAGNDVLDGGEGNDTLNGGGGRDTYVMSLNGGHDTVVDSSEEGSIISLTQGDGSALSYARAGQSLLITNAQLNASFFMADFYGNTGSWTLKTASGQELDLRALAAAGSQSRSPEQRREDFYTALMAGQQPVELGNGHFFSGIGSESGTDSEGNEYAYSFSRDRKLIQSDAANITASEDGSYFSTESTYLRTVQRTVTHDVTNTTYSQTISTTPGRSFPMPAGVGGVEVPAGWRTHLSADGQWFLDEPDVTKVTLTPHNTTNTVTDTYSQDLYRTVVTASVVVEDIRAGDQANTISLQGTATKLVMAGAGNDVITRDDPVDASSVYGPDAFPADWVDGGAGDDIVQLGNGDDELSGGAGSDYLDGGAGADTYVVTADDDAWDTVNDSARAVIDVALDAIGRHDLDVQLVSDLSRIMLNPVRENSSYRDTLRGQVEATPENLNELMRIDRAQQTFNEIYRQTSGEDEAFGPVSFTLASEGLDRFISNLSGSPYTVYGESWSGSDLVRPRTVFSEQNMQAYLQTATDTVRFGDGIFAAGLQIAWGRAELDGKMMDALLLSWGGSGGIKVVMPDDGAALGQGIEVFEFADGSTMTMQQMLALAPPRGSTEGSTVVSGAAIQAQEILQDHALSFTIPADAFVVPANTTLGFNARLAGSGEALPNWLVFDTMTGTFSGTPGNGEVGVLSVEVTAIQSATQSAKQTFTLNVVNVNDAPVTATPIAAQQANADALFTLTVPTNTFADVDANDTLAYTATRADGGALPSWLAFDAVTQTFSGTPGSGDVGSVSIKVVVTDAAGASASSEFGVNVAAPDPLAGNDTLTADTNNTPLHGGAGNDTLTGSWASSTLYGDSGNDVLTATGGPSNVLDGGEGDDTLTGGWGQDILRGGEGNNTIHANGGNSMISAGAGDDLIVSSWGDDQIDAGEGNNTISAGGGTNTITSGNGNDIISADGINLIQAGAGNDQITTTWGADTIDAGAGDDIIRAGGGGNTVWGGLGNDQIISDQWSDDRYVFARGDGQDLMLDGGGQDRLTLENVQSDQLWFSQMGNDLEVSIIGTQDHITLQNWYVGSQYPGSQYHMEEFKTSDGKTLLDSQVQNLVSAMAAFSPPPAGQTTLSASYAAALTPVIAANWQ